MHGINLSRNALGKAHLVLSWEISRCDGMGKGSCINGSNFSN